MGGVKEKAPAPPSLFLAPIQGENYWEEGKATWWSCVGWPMGTGREAEQIAVQRRAQ